MSDISTMPRTREAGRSVLRMRPPFNARPVCAAGRESRSTEGPYSTHYTATASYLYINRLSGSDRFGAVPDSYLMRGDLIASGRCHPQKLPPRLRSGDTLWREADDAAALDPALSRQRISSPICHPMPIRSAGRGSSRSMRSTTSSTRGWWWIGLYTPPRATATSRRLPRTYICWPRRGSGARPAGSGRASGSGSPMPIRFATPRTTGSD